MFGVQGLGVASRIEVSVLAQVAELRQARQKGQSSKGGLVSPATRKQRPKPQTQKLKPQTLSPKP